MNKKLSDGQIEYLFAFCRTKDVSHYDLQIEIVDHLASSIEEKWEENPDIPFEEALNEAFCIFGIFGFSKLKAAKEKALQKNYSRLYRKCILEFYNLPKIILTIAIILMVLTVLRFSENNSGVIIILIVIYIITGFYYYLYLYPRKNALDIVPGKSFLLYDHLKSLTGNISMLLVIPLNTIIILYNINISLLSSNNLWVELLSSILISFVGIASYAWAVFLPKRIKEDFIKEFPQFVKS